MAIEIKPEVIKEIAGWLDTGMLCFYHKTTGQLESYPENLEDSGMEDMWSEVTEKIEANPDDYIAFEPMPSPEAFRVMETFVSTIEDTSTHTRFTDALSYKGPFKNFSNLLHHYPELREQWFMYKSASYIAYVEQLIAFENDDFESDLDGDE
jgi:hypothetical protein